jgi:hypothetical protein
MFFTPYYIVKAGFKDVYPTIRLARSQWIQLKEAIA